MNPDENRDTGYWQQNPTDEVTPVVAATDYPTETYTPAQPIVPTEETAQVAPQTNPVVELPQDIPVQWVAKEYLHIDKGTGWYVLFGIVVAGFIALDVFLVRSWLYTFSILIIIMAISLVVYVRRPPRDVQYSLSGRQGLYVGEKLYHLTDFKAFGLIKDGDQNSILLIPVKRFAPGVSVYFPEEVGERIVDILGQRLPMEELKLDAVDILVRKLRL